MTASVIILSFLMIHEPMVFSYMPIPFRNAVSGQLQLSPFNGYSNIKITDHSKIMVSCYLTSKEIVVSDLFALTLKTENKCRHYQVKIYFQPEVNVIN